MTDITGNKGEWSEIYVFLRLLDIGKLFAADADLNKIDTVFYDIIKIIRKEKAGILEFVYDKTSKMISVIDINSGDVLISLTSSQFQKEADKLYKKISQAKGSSFSFPETEAFLSKIKIDTLKAKSDDKSDIRIKIHDVNTGFQAVQGFSIKSRLGQPSTLINAGKTTNFIYKVCGCNDEIMNAFNNCSKFFKDRFSSIGDKCSFSYVGMENSVFENNLILLDSNLPQICAAMILDHYRNGLSNLKENLTQITTKNPLNYNMEKGQPFYSYKLKKLLVESALGMLPSKPWNGIADATGGYIIVREDGEVLCYHLFNRNEFEDYLINNTKFETASTSRYLFGDIYKENNDYFLKLNLQVRFIK